MRTSSNPVEELAGQDFRPQSARKYRPQTTAWLVLWVSFTMFCLLVAGAILGGKNFYDTASNTGKATLSLEGGIVLFRDSVTSTLVNATDDMSLREGDEVLVGQGARASLHLFDGSTVQMQPGAEMAIKEMRASRFHAGFTRVALSFTKGSARILVGSPKTLENTFTAITPYGQAMLRPGSYGVEVSDGQARVSAREGSATVNARTGTADISAGQKVVLAADGTSGPLPEGDALVKNGNFSQGFSQWIPLDLNEAGRPEEPGRRELASEKIAGQDTMVLHISRLSPRATHNETGLAQVINKDVSDYTSLRLRANIKVTGQSLSGGGYMGYEYPVMIRARYRDETGGQIDWTHGFFASNPEGRATPNGEEVPRGDWVQYEGDLTQVSPRPVYLISLEVVGAGHTFDGSIANVDLVGK